MQTINVPATVPIQVLDQSDLTGAVMPVIASVADIDSRLVTLGATVTSDVASLEADTSTLAHRIDALPAQASGIPMPRGHRPKWTEMLADDFLTVSSGDFAAVYGDRFITYPETYPDTSKRGKYTDRYLTVQGSIATAVLQTVAGQPWGCTLVPRGADAAAGAPASLYSAGLRVSQCVRIRLDDGWKVAHLLFPKAGVGEIDFPEFEGTNLVTAFVHPSDGSVQWQNPTLVSADEWHVLTTEWVTTPTPYVRFLCDGLQVGRLDGPRVPTSPMSWRLQCETSLRKDAAGAYLPVPPAAIGTVEWDWITVHTPI